MHCFLTVGHVYKKVDLSKTRQAVACHHDTMTRDTMTAALPRAEQRRTIRCRSVGTGEVTCPAAGGL